MTKLKFFNIRLLFMRHPSVVFFLYSLSDKWAYTWSKTLYFPRKNNISNFPPSVSDLTYAIVEGDDSGTFTIRQFTGEIFLAQELDYEKITEYTLKVRCSDGVYEGRTTRTCIMYFCRNVFINLSVSGTARSTPLLGVLREVLNQIPSFVVDRQWCF